VLLLEHLVLERLTSHLREGLHLITPAREYTACVAGGDAKPALLTFGFILSNSSASL